MSWRIAHTDHQPLWLLLIILIVFASFLSLHSCLYVKVIYTPDELRSLIVQRAFVDPSQEIPIPFELNDEIRKAALQATNGIYSKRGKVMALLYQILGQKGVDLQYDEFITNTAVETYKTGRGNCLSFTNLLVGMARSIGISAFYVEVLTEGEYNLLDGLVVNQRHICAGYETGGTFELVDLSVNAKKHLSYRRLDDIEAMAHYLNNIGYDLLKEGKNEEAVRTFQMAVRICPSFAWGYNNLAVALNRKGDLKDAIGNYEKAIKLDPSYEAPYGNIASLYFDQGQKAKADEFLTILDRIKSRNPYQHIARALMLKEKQDYSGALEELKIAISLDRKNYRAHIEMARIYIVTGETQLALHHLEKALKLSPGNEEVQQILNSLRAAPSKPSPSDDSGN